MSYNLYLIDQNTGNRNSWQLNESELHKQIIILLDMQKQSEVIIIEKR